MRAEIYRQLIALDFSEEEARAMSVEFARLLKGLGRAGVRAAGSVGQALAVSLLHTWVLALFV